MGLFAFQDTKDSLHNTALKVVIKWLILDQLVVEINTLRSM